MMLLVGARASPGHRQSAVCRLSPPGPAYRTPEGGPPAFRSARSLFSWLEDAGLWSGRRRPTDAGAPWYSRALGFAARPGPAHEVQHVAPGEAVWKPAAGAADVRRPRRRRWCLCSKPYQCPTHATGDVTNIRTIFWHGEEVSRARSHRCSRASIRLGTTGHQSECTARRLDRVIAPARSRGSTTRSPCRSNACSASGAT